METSEIQLGCSTIARAPDVVCASLAFGLAIPVSAFYRTRLVQDAQRGIAGTSTMLLPAGHPQPTAPSEGGSNVRA